MAPASEHGRRWNLTPDETIKLKSLWMAVFDVAKVEHRQHHTAKPASPGTKIASKTRWSVRVPLFGGKAQEEPDIIPGNESSRWTKDYQESIAKYTPDQLHQGLWNMPGGRHPDDLLLRFLRARDWDVEAALMMLIPAITFVNYNLHVYDDLLLRGDGIPEDNTHQDFINQLRMGKGFIYGRDKDGRPVLYIRARLHHQAEQSDLTMTRFIVYGIEMLRLVMPADVDTATLVFDLTGSSVSNIDLGPVRFIMTDQHFPETLGKVILYRAPWFVAGLWRSIRGWLDPEVAYKVNFAANVDELEQHIPRESILKELGGDKEYTWKYVEPREGENAIMKQVQDRDQMIAARNDLIKSFESETAAWVHDKNDGKTRDEIAEQLKRSFWELDPYIRARSVYDRLGMIQSGQEV